MMKNTRTRLIACGIFRQEITRLMEEGVSVANAVYLNPGLHNHPEQLEEILEKSIQKELRKSPDGIVVVYGDVCLGFKGQMKKLTEKYRVAKIDALNCIDCLLGGEGNLLAIDPKHEYFFLNPAWIDLEFGNRDMTQTSEAVKKEFGCLSGLYLLDTLGNLSAFSEQIESIKEYTGLPVVGRQNIGLCGIKKVITKSIEKAG